MKEQIIFLIKQINKNKKEISFEEIACICVNNPNNLPQSKSDIYFLIMLLKGFGFLVKNKKTFLINWAVVKNGF